LRLSPGVQWILLGLGLIALWYFWPTSTRRVYSVSGRRVEHDGFQALSYVGVSHEPGRTRVSPERLREHLEALRAAGYRPVTLDDVRAFLAEKRPLPARPLLLLFEDGRRDTVREAEPLLEEYDVPVTFIVQPEAMEEKRFDYPLWHHLRALATSGRWSFATSGLTGLDTLLAEALGDESADGTRLARRIDETALLLARRLEGEAPIAFVFPVSHRVTPSVANIHAVHRMVARHFPVAFSARGYAYNARGSAATGLTHLRVDPTWTGKELLRRLEAQGGRRDAISRFSERDWILTLGRVSCEDGTITLEPTEHGSAEAWLAGSEAWRCLSGRVVLPARAGTQTWLYLRSRPGGDFLRLGWTGSRVELQTCVEPGELRRLAFATPRSALDEVAVSFRMFDRRMRFTARGCESPRRSFPVPPTFERGMVGLVSWSARDAAGPVVIRALHLEPRLARADHSVSVEAERQRPGESPDVAAPPWFAFKRSGGAPRLTGEPDPALVYAAAHEGSSVWPLVHVPAPLDEREAAALTTSLRSALDRTRCQGFLLDVRSWPSSDPVSKLLRQIQERDPSLPIGVAMEPGTQALDPGVADRVRWIAVPRRDDRRGDPSVRAVAPSHKILLLPARVVTS